MLVRISWQCHGHHPVAVLYSSSFEINDILLMVLRITYSPVANQHDLHTRSGLATFVAYLSSMSLGDCQAHRGLATILLLFA